MARLEEVKQIVARTEQGVVLREREVSAQLDAVYDLGGKLVQALDPKKFPVTQPFGRGAGYIISSIDRTGRELQDGYLSPAEISGRVASHVVREHQNRIGEFTTPEDGTIKVSTHDTRFQSYKKDPSGRMVPDGDPKPGFTGLFDGVRITDPSLPEGYELILGKLGGRLALRVSNVDNRDVDLFSVIQSGPNSEGVQIGGSDPRGKLKSDGEWVDLAQRKIQYALDHAEELVLKAQAPQDANTYQAEPNLSQPDKVDAAPASSTPLAPQAPTPGV